ARNDDGIADVLIGHEVTAGQLLRLLPKIYAGTHVQHPAVEIVRAREVVVEPLAGHPPPPDAFGDGELVGALPLSVTVEAGGVQLLAPAEVGGMTTPAERYAAAVLRQQRARSEVGRFAATFPFELDDFQVRACEAGEAGEGVLVAAPTGAGKTVVGEFAVHLAL